MTDTISAPNTKKKFRSSSYPAFGLEEAINATSVLRDKLGSGPYSREAAAQALGYKGVSGASSVKIAAITHFGLLTRTGDTYKQSILADRILMPTSEQDKKEAIIESLKTPKLYEKLITDYSGKSLPSMLSNILFHTHKINERVTKDVAATFGASLEYAGLLQNGVITEVSSGANDPSVPGGNVPAIQQVQSHPSKPILSSSQNTYSVPLPSGIEIHFPASMAYDFALGEFSAAIKMLEEKAQQIMKGKSEAKSVSSDEGLPPTTKKLENP